MAPSRKPSWKEAAKAVLEYIDAYEAIHGHRILMIDHGNPKVAKVAKQIQAFRSLHDWQQIARYLDIDLDQPMPKVERRDNFSSDQSVFARIPKKKQKAATSSRSLLSRMDTPPTVRARTNAPSKTSGHLRRSNSQQTSRPSAPFVANHATDSNSNTASIGGSASPTGVVDMQLEDVCEAKSDASCMNLDDRSHNRSSSMVHPVVGAAMVSLGWHGRRTNPGLEPGEIEEN